ncbi:MAG: GGDEF domain-containing protein [Nitrospirae bacterium]|nr:GGDEF domain-containing protein [Candidatus Manganitrophaceae bacterium]
MKKPSQLAEEYFIKKPPEFTKAMAQQHHQAMNVLLRVTRVTGSHADMELSLNTLLDLAGEIVPYDWGLFYIWDDDKNIFQLKASKGLGKTFPPLLEKGNLIARWTFQASKPIFIPENAAKVMEHYFSVHKTDAVISIPVLVSNRLVAIFQLGGNRQRRFKEEDALLIWMLGMQSEALFHNSQTEREFLRRMAMTDGLTGLFNRRYFDEQVDREIQRSYRTGKPFVLMMMDVDFFKKYNDRYKHLKGDQALREIAMILKARLRQIDTVSRFGGEEFSVLLPETDEVGGLAVAKHISFSVKNHLFSGKEKKRDVRMTMSIGCSVFPYDGKDKEELIHRADLALYHAKEAGRDQVILFSQLKNKLPNQQLKEEQNVF